MQELIKIGVNKDKILIIPNCSPYDKIKKKFKKLKSRKSSLFLQLEDMQLKKKVLTW